MCTEAGMYALRERRVHVTQDDFEMAVAKVHYHGNHGDKYVINVDVAGDAERLREEHVN